MLSPFIVNQISQELLDRSIDASYQIRGASRAHFVVPKEQKPDYLFRDYTLTALNPMVFEAGRRMLNVVYMAPKMTEILELNKLKHLYQGQFENIRNYKTLFDEPTLQRLLLPLTVKEHSLYTVPEIYSNAGQIFQAKTDPVLAHHLFKRLNYKAYVQDLVQQGKVPPHVADALFEGINVLRKDKLNIEKRFEKPLEQALYRLQYKESLTPQNIAKIKTALKVFFEGPLPETHLDKVERFTSAVSDNFDRVWHNFKRRIGLHPWNDKYDPSKAILKDGLLQSTHLDDTSRQIVQKAYQQMQSLADQPKAILENFKKLQQDLAEHVGHHWLLSKNIKLNANEAALLKKLSSESMAARVITRQLQLLKKGFVWPDAVVTTLGMFLSYGVIGTWISNKFVIPWQRRYTEKGGDASIVEKPMVVSLLPGFALFMGLMLHKKSPVAKLSYLNKYLVAAGVSFATYCALGLGWIRHRLKNAPLPSAQNNGGSSPHLAAVAQKRMAVGNTAFAANTASINPFLSQVNPSFKLLRPWPLATQPPLSVNSQSY
ncbi:MAG: hypothetical protein VKK59_06085 [Vampirovibrionales bacterium]|nr:hypothetical protein [Vampirovibrionales bacterium]